MFVVGVGAPWTFELQVPWTSTGKERFEFDTAGRCKKLPNRHRDGGKFMKPTRSQHGFRRQKFTTKTIHLPKSELTALAFRLFQRLKTTIQRTAIKR